MGMMRRRFGRIISISSVVAVTGNAGQGNYAASKAGLIGMTKALAQEVASRGVTANCIAPGFVGSAMTDALNEKQKEAILARVPAKRLGTVGRGRRGGGLSRQRRGGLHHRPDASRQWWYGHDMKREMAAVPMPRCGISCPPSAAGQALRSMLGPTAMPTSGRRVRPSAGRQFGDAAAKNSGRLSPFPCAGQDRSLVGGTALPGWSSLVNLRF